MIELLYQKSDFEEMTKKVKDPGVGLDLNLTS